MAAPTFDEVAALVSEISDLKNALDETSLDQAAIEQRYDAALSGLVNSSGQFDAMAWSQLTEQDQLARAAALSRLKQLLENAFATAEPVVRIGPKSFMYKEAASNFAILVLTAIALLGLFVDLYLIQDKWTEATSGIVEKQPAASPTPTPSAISATPSESERTERTNQTKKPTEGTVLYMVMLLGALGGFLRLASSMSNYVGNRQLLKSWIIYYLLTPIQGAALAPMVYLLLRVGVLNPANPAPGSSSPTDSLNLIGIYAFAGLAGLFSKQAIEMLADVFSTIFKKAETKDALDKSKGEPTKPTPKSGAS